MALSQGSLLGHFEVVSLLGEGGMGQVYRTRDTVLGREVAVKVLPEELSAQPDRLARFANEARAASALSHPNLVTVFEVGQEGSLPYFAMELVEGETLRQLLAKGGLPVRKALEISAQIADGLSRAHDAGIVHRDLKPENVIVTRDGLVKILDFGLAKLSQPDAPGGSNQGMTAVGFVIGTAGYMSPEQACGLPVDYRSDQFSLGVILYELLTGKRAFERSTAVQTLTAIIQDEPEPLERLNSKVPPPVRWVVERCISKDPEERYTATRDLARELRKLSQGLTLLGDPSLLQAAATARTEIPQAAIDAKRRLSFRRATRTALVSLAVSSAVLLAGTGGFWLRGLFPGNSSSPSGELLLGTSTRALLPRVSPDGSTVAFLTVVGGVAQIGVLRPSSGDWTALTKQAGFGSIYRLSWSPDGAKLYFDRVGETPRGIYSVPAIGGEERLVLEDAQDPEALPDGSILAIRREPDGLFRFLRFWPATGKTVAFGPRVSGDGQGPTVLPFPDGREAIFWGRIFEKGSEDGAARAHVLDLSTGNVRDFAALVPLAPPLALDGSGRRILAAVRRGDLHEIVSVSRDGQETESLVSLTSRPWYLAAGPDGALYVSVMQGLTEFLRFPEQGGNPDRAGESSSGFAMTPVETGDGRLLVPSRASGRLRFLLLSPLGELHPLLDSSESAFPPAVSAGPKRLAFMTGGGSSPLAVAVASVEDGRIVVRRELPRGLVPRTLASSFDGTTLYASGGGAVWAIPLDGEPKKLTNGDAVAVHPNGLELLVQRSQKAGVRLVRVPTTGGQETPLEFEEQDILAPAPLSPGALAADGRVLLTVVSRSSWFWGPAILDPASRAVMRVPVTFDGDVLGATWSHGGSILATGVVLRSELWRFRPRL